MANGAAAVDVRGVARRFGQRWVLRGLDLRVEPGEIVALTGRNGSGKTTLLRVIATLLRPTRGGGSVFGLDLVADAGAVRERVGFLGHSAGLYDDLTAAENLEFAARMRGAHPGRAVIDSVLERVRLRVDADERVRGFSAGMRRRLALARLLLSPPDLLLLDEPYASFDADGIAVVNRFCTEIAQRGGAVLVATHDIARGREVLERRVHIENGRAAARNLDSEDEVLVSAGIAL